MLTRPTLRGVSEVVVILSVVVTVVVVTIMASLSLAGFFQREAAEGSTIVLHGWAARPIGTSYVEVKLYVEVRGAEVAVQWSNSSVMLIGGGSQLSCVAESSYPDMLRPRGINEVLILASCERVELDSVVWVKIPCVARDTGHVQYINAMIPLKV